MKQIVTILVLASVILIVNCGTQENPCSLSEEVWSELKKLDSIFNDTLVRYKQKGWMKINYNEPDIFESDHETYRFVKNSFSWYVYTKIVRVEKLENHYKATIKEFVDTIESTRVLTNIKNDEFELTKEGWHFITNRLEAENFWISTESNSKQLLHGSSWYIEGYKPLKDKCSMRNYHGIHGIYPVDSLYIAMHNLFDNLENEKRATIE